MSKEAKPLTLLPLSGEDAQLFLATASLRGIPGAEEALEKINPIEGDMEVIVHTTTKGNCITGITARPVKKE